MLICSVLAVKWSCFKATFMSNKPLLQIYAGITSTNLWRGCMFPARNQVSSLPRGLLKLKASLKQLIRPENHRWSLYTCWIVKKYTPCAWGIHSMQPTAECLQLWTVGASCLSCSISSVVCTCWRRLRSRRKGLGLITGYEFILFLIKHRAESKKKKKTPKQYLHVVGLFLV